MMKFQRQIDLQQYINLKGHVTIAELLDKFQVSKATLNRDLTDLENEGSIQKVHGGVVSKIASQVFELSSSKKEVYNKDYKSQIAEKAVSMIENNQSIIIDSGSTMYYLARALVARKDLENITVITNDLKVAYTLSENENISLIILGGMKHKDSFDIYGPTAVDILKSLNANKYFMATSAFDFKCGITHTDYDDILIKKAMMESSKDIILCADSSKYGLVKRWSLCDIDAIDTLISDDRMKPEELKKIKEVCENIILVNEAYNN